MKLLLLCVLIVAFAGCGEQQTDPMTTEQAEQLGRETVNAYREGVAKQLGYESAAAMDAEAKRAEEIYEEYKAKSGE